MIKCLFSLLLVSFFQLQAAPLYKDGEVIVKFKTAKAIPDGYSQDRDVVFSFTKNLKVLKIETKDTSVLDAVKELNRNPNVEYAEPNYLIHLHSESEIIPNDEKLFHQWGIRNTGHNYGIVDVDIDATNAWTLTTGSKDIVVAIIDTGIEYTHDDLESNIWINEAELNGKPDVDDDKNGYIDDIHGVNFINSNGDPMDDNGHGTHCAGVIGAKGNNTIGIAGINWNVSLMGIKFLDKNGSGGTVSAIKGVEYAARNGANIINNSWGGSGYSYALHEALTFAASKNILIVNAAGNSNQNLDTRPSYPASYKIDGLIAVASSDKQDLKSVFSSFGKQSVHLAAPGDVIYSTILNNEYGSMSGTSMATPHVAGAAALLMAYMPELSIKEIKERLIKSTEKVKNLNEKILSAGRLNVNNALLGIYPEKGWAEVDPSLFVEVEKTIDSPHPYPRLHDEKWPIHHPGAKYMRVHFSMFELEKRYDFVDIFDSVGYIVDKISGDQNGYWSEAVKGDTMYLRLRSDRSFQAKGFTVDKYAVVMENN